LKAIPKKLKKQPSRTKIQNKRGCLDLWTTNPAGYKNTENRLYSIGRAQVLIINVKG